MLDEKQIRKNKKEIISLLKSTERDGIENLIGWFEESDFFTAPASTIFHGNFTGGLASHSYEVYKCFKRQVNYYNLNVPDNSIVISSLCHDCCKINFYIENQLKTGNISESKPYKVQEDFPFGHGEKSAILTQKYISLNNQESMLIRWHMGSEDSSWGDYKEKIEKLYPEVVVFQNVDKEVSLIKKI